MKPTLLLAIACAGCAASNAHGNQSDAGGSGGDAPTPGCQVFLTFDPAAPVAAPDTSVRATANASGVGGVPTFAWTVTQGGIDIPFVDAQPDHSAIDFPATTAGVVHVEAQVGGGNFCPLAVQDLNVLSAGTTASYRLRVNAPPAPPQERTLAFPSGTTAYAFGTFSLDPGLAQSGVVRDASANPVVAYLRFIPHGHPDAYVEAFSGASGTFGNVNVLDELHDVLVIPLVGVSAPRLVTAWQPGTTLITVGAGQPATGTVLAPNGTGLVGATVALTLDGVPSRTATTTAGGAFSLAYEPKPGATVTIEVEPPASSGLPRLSATSASFTVASGVTIAYASALAPRDVAGLKITRGAGVLAQARVTLAGTIAAAGTITAGASASATGDVRATALTNASGILPTLKAANAPLAVVVEVGAADVAVASLDLSAAPPATLDAPAPLVTPGKITDAPGAQIAGATVVAVPSGGLALASAQPLSTTTAMNGTFSLPFASGGTYTLRVRDPGARGAAFELANVTAATLPATIALAAAVKVTGSVTQAGGANPVSAAAVTILCKACTGVDRTRPLAETASATNGTFTLAVPDLPP